MQDGAAQRRASGEGVAERGDGVCFGCVVGVLDEDGEGYEEAKDTVWEVSEWVSGKKRVGKSTD